MEKNFVTATGFSKGGKVRGALAALALALGLLCALMCTGVQAAYAADAAITTSVVASTVPAEGAAGTVTAAETAAAGASVQVTATPSTGYYLAGLTYSYTTGAGEAAATTTTAIDVANSGKYDGAGGTYTFTMPDAAVNVEATFVTIVWDGTLDFTWYDETSYVANAIGSYYMYYPAQWEALAWICSEDLYFLTEASVDKTATAAQDSTKTVGEYMASKGWTKAYQYNTNGNVPLVVGTVPLNRSDLHVKNNKETQEVYGGMGQNYFSGRTFYVMRDMDFGGTGTDTFKDTTLTSLTSAKTAAAGLNAYYTYMGGHNYYPVGSQARNDGVYDCLNTTNDYHFWGIFCGSVNGQGHLMDNIYCDRGDASNIGGATGGENYYQSTALIGRLGLPDSTDCTLASNDATVENIAVDGFLYGERSVGGIIGKTLHVATGHKVYVKNCINFATIWSTQSKGSGGIIGASWNDPQVYNCVNFGRCINGYSNGCGGVTGTTEADFWNCYNVGMVSINSGNPASFGSQNGGGVVNNCYALVGSTFSGSGLYSTAAKPYLSYNLSGVNAINSISDASSTFLASINNGGRDFVQLGTSATSTGDKFTLKSSALGTALATQKLFYGYDGTAAGKLTQTGVANLPIPRAFIVDTSTVNDVVLTSQPTKTAYIEGQTFDTAGMVITASWSDGTSSQVTDYTVSKTEPVSLEDTAVTVSGTVGGKEYSFDIAITVSPDEVNSITVKTAPSKKTYGSDEELDTTGMVVCAYYKKASSTAITLNAEDYTAALDKATGTVTVTYTYKEKTVEATTTVTVLDTPAPVLSEDGYYQLTCANDVVWYAALFNTGLDNDAKAQLCSDIDLSAATAFKGIGTGSSTKSFQGTFDGQGHKLTVALSGSSATAVFPYVYNGALIQNVIVAGSVTGTSSGKVGGLVAEAHGGTILNCGNEASVSSTYAYGTSIGGLIGYIVPDKSEVAVSGCYNKGAVSQTGSTTSGTSYGRGGLVGYVNIGSTSYYPVTVTECYNAGAVNAPHCIGGIVGLAKGYNGKLITVSNCYNTGTVTPVSANATYTGAILGYGYNTYFSFASCYYLDSSCAQAKGTNSKAGTFTATSKTSDEMKASEFVTALNGETGTAWKADGAGKCSINGGNPVLSWQVVPVLENITSVTLDAETFDLGIQGATAKTHAVKATTEPMRMETALTWTSSNEAVATVDQSGVVTAVSAGTATITAKATDAVSASCTVQVKAVGDALAASVANLTYTGAVQTPVVTVKDGDTAVTSYTATIAPAQVKNARSYTLTVAGTGAYEGLTATTVFEVLPMDLSHAVNVTVDAAGLVYTGSALTPGVTVTSLDETVTLAKGVDYTLEYGENVNAGAGTVRVIGKGNYSGECTKAFTISSKNLSASADVTVDDADLTYSGRELSPVVTVKDGDKVLEGGDGKDYSVTYANNINAGTGYAFVVFSGNYAGSKNATFTIGKADGSAATVTCDAEGLVYTGSALTPAVDVSLDGYTLVASDYDVTYQNNVNATTVESKAKAIATFKGNFQGTASASFDIGTASIADAQITMSEQTYTGSDLTPEPTQVKVGNLVLAKGTDYTIAGYENNKNVGESAQITIQGTGNFSGVATGTFAIKAIGFSVAEIAAQTYTGSAIEPELSVTSSAAEGALEKGTDYEVEFASNIEVGTAYATVTGKGNYTGEIVKTFAITAKDMSETEGISVDAQDPVYTGSALTPAVRVTDGDKVLGEGEDKDYTLVYSDNVNAGTAHVAVTFCGNYAGAKTVDFAIAPANGADATVTCAPASVQETGEAIVAKTVTVELEGFESGLVEGTDYAVTYADNIKPGTAKAIVTFKGNFTGTATGTFAITAKPAATYAVSFDAGSTAATGEVPTMSAQVAGATFALPAADKLKLEGWDFTGWALAGDETGTIYQAGDEFTMPAEDVAFTATWTLHSTPGAEPVKGDDRYATAAAIAAKAFPDGAEGVVVATGTNFPDALAASGLAGMLDWPVVLAGKDGVDQVVLDQIKSLGAKQAVVVGGTGVVSEDIFNTISGLVENGAYRIAGDNRYDTAVKVYNYGIEQIEGAEWADTCIIATGTNYPDALSISGYAFANKAPIFLTDSENGLAAETLAAIKEGGFTQAIVVGGENAVSAADFNLVNMACAKTTRLEGTDRYATSKAIAEFCLDNGCTANGACIATGANFPDALAGGALAGRTNTIMLLGCDDNCSAFDVLTDKGVDHLYYLGGDAAVTPVMRAAAVKAAGLE